MTQPRLLIFDPLVLFTAAARQGGPERAHAARDRLVELGRAGAVVRHAVFTGDAVAARAWFASPSIEGLDGGLGLLACADRVYAVGDDSLAAWSTLLRHVLAQTRTAPAQTLLLGRGAALDAARVLSLPAHDADDAEIALAWLESRLRQRYGRNPGAFGTAWGRVARVA